MTFLQNPFQKKYIPVLVCLALGVAAVAITHSVQAGIVMGVLGVLQYLTADKPLSATSRMAYSVLSAIFISMALYYYFISVTVAALISGATAVLPLSILLTREIEV